MQSKLLTIDSAIAESNAPVVSNDSGWKDFVGVVASIACAIHCAAMPFVIAYLPAMGLSFLADEAFHKWMAVACFAIAALAFVPGFRKHGRLTPVVIGAAGLSLITVAAFCFSGDCCAACEQDAEITTSQVSLTETASVECVASEATEDACCEICCSEAEPATAKEDVSVASFGFLAISEQNAWLRGLLPWLTPIGGLLLVSAHLLNRRFGCLCGCCER